MDLAKATTTDEFLTFLLTKSDLQRIDWSATTIRRSRAAHAQVAAAFQRKGDLERSDLVPAFALIVALAVVSLGTNDGLFAQLEDALKSSRRGLIDVLRWNKHEKELERRFDVAMGHSIERDCGRNLQGRADSYPHPHPLVLCDET